jgi:hypothetical protein
MYKPGGKPMHTIHFQTKIRNGTIEIPREHRQLLQLQGVDDTVRVVIIMTERQPDTNLIDHLMAHPIAIGDFVPLTRDELHERN